MGLDDAPDAAANPANAFQIHPTPRHVDGLRVGLGRFAGAALRAAHQPFQHVAFRIQDAAGIRPAPSRSGRWIATAGWISRDRSDV